VVYNTDEPSHYVAHTYSTRQHTDSIRIRMQARVGGGVAYTADELLHTYSADVCIAHVSIRIAYAYVCRRVLGEAWPILRMSSWSSDFLIRGDDVCYVDVCVCYADVC
jgi:hypothetical protein